MCGKVPVAFPCGSRLFSHHQDESLLATHPTYRPRKDHLYVYQDIYADSDQKPRAETNARSYGRIYRFPIGSHNRIFGRDNPSAILWTDKVLGVREENKDLVSAFAEALPESLPTDQNPSANLRGYGAQLQSFVDRYRFQKSSLVAKNE